MFHFVSVENADESSTQAHQSKKILKGPIFPVRSHVYPHRDVKLLQLLLYMYFALP